MAFLTKYSGINTCKVIDSFVYKGLPVVVLERLPAAIPGFLSDYEISRLETKDLIRILDTLLSIQAANTDQFIVHRDLAPHNIYYTKDQLVIVDWDNYHLAEHKYMRMYDYATLWAWLHNNEQHIESVYDEVYVELKHRDLYEDFLVCFQLQVRNFEKDVTKFQVSKARKLFNYILRK